MLWPAQSESPWYSRTDCAAAGAEAATATATQAVTAAATTHNTNTPATGHRCCVSGGVSSEQRAASPAAISSVALFGSARCGCCRLRRLRMQDSSPLSALSGLPISLV